MEEDAIGQEDTIVVQELRKTLDELNGVGGESQPTSVLGGSHQNNPWWDNILVPILLAVLAIVLIDMKRKYDEAKMNMNRGNEDQQREWIRKRRAEMFANRSNSSTSRASSDHNIEGQPLKPSSSSSERSLKQNDGDGNVQMRSTMNESNQTTSIASNTADSSGVNVSPPEEDTSKTRNLVAAPPPSGVTTTVSTVTPMDVNDSTAVDVPDQEPPSVVGASANPSPGANASSGCATPPSTKKQRIVPETGASNEKSLISVDPIMKSGKVKSSASNGAGTGRRLGGERNASTLASTTVANETHPPVQAKGTAAMGREAAALAAANRVSRMTEGSVDSAAQIKKEGTTTSKKPPPPALKKPLPSNSAKTNKMTPSKPAVAVDGSSSPSKKKKRRTADPLHVLTQVLTQLTNWTVKSQSDDKTSAAVIKMQPRVHSGQAQEIRLTAEERSLGWEMLSHPKIRASLEAIMEEATQKQHMEDLISLSVRSDLLRWDGLPPHAAPATKGASAAETAPFDNLVALTSHCSTYSAKSLCRMLHLDLSQHVFLTDSSLDEEEGLFSDMFTSGSAGARSQRTPLDNFITLLGRTPTTLSKTFLMELDSCYKTLCPKEQSSFAKLLVRILLSRVETVALSMEAVNAVANLFAVWPPATHVVLERIKVELTAPASATTTGKDFERRSWLRPLLCLAAYTLPNAGEERSQQNKRRFQQEVESLTNYPICVYERQNRSVWTFLEQARRTMKSARETSILILKKVAMQDKQLLFDWIRVVIRHNEALATIPHAELLATNGIAALTSSRRFLFGLATVLVGLCADNLVKKGCSDLDTSYLFQKQSPFADEVSSCLVRSASGTKTEQERPSGVKKYKGLVEFFFVSCYLTRISLYPTLRVERQLNQQLRSILEIVQKAASATHGGPPLSPAVAKVAKPAVSAMIGMEAAILDKDIAGILIKFTLLQLNWIRELASSRKTDALLRSIPDWICKDPSVWLARVSVMNPPQFTPLQAEQAVECATELLRYGTTEGSTFSPVVMHLLVKIIADFARAGYSRAKQRHQRGTPTLPDDDIFGDTSVYTSFDKHNIGVTVYTNRLVCTQLCPVLIQTFPALDIIEGLDVDREHGFDKFNAKLDIVDLMLRLWCHPNGECRRSVVGLPRPTLQKFGKSISAAIGYLLDDACHKLTDMAELRRSPRHMNRRLLDPYMKGVGGALNASRMLFLLLTKLSEDDRPAAAFGSMEGGELSTMIAHFVDLTTGNDGGLHSDMDGRHGSRERSATFITRYESMSPVRRDAVVQSIFDDRHFLWTKLGFDVSRLCHHLLALAARWNDAASKKMLKEEYTCIVSFLASNDDYTEEHYRKLLERLVMKSETAFAGYNARVQSALAMLQADGWRELDSRKSSSQRDDDIEERRQARRYQMSVADLTAIANNATISKFLDEVRDCREKTAAAASLALGKLDINVEEAENGLFSIEPKLSEARYGERLQDWLVSSEEFARSGVAQGGSPTFAHYYDATARSRGVTSSGKILVKEARRCHKNLPVPHPNSASFVCFAEERMDLSRAVITGPVDTPYAHGVFVFDVFFPSTYPQIPPLMTFMTTGGGQTRFNPNLYQDGKVCLSLLNTWHAQDNSQKWNPKLSSLAQILLSIQTQLLVEEPYFNEPGYEQRRGTEAGRSGSARYNTSLRLATLRHGILAPLRDPPLGFEEVSKRHFIMCRQRILVQARRWMLETKRGPSKTLFPRFERAYHELLSLLSTLKKEDGDGDSPRTDEDCLPPLKNDIKALRSMGDKEFLRKYCGKLAEPDKKPSAAASTQARRRVVFQNRGPPWNDELGIFVVCYVYGTLVINNPWNGLDVERPWLKQRADGSSNEASYGVDNDEFEEIYQ